MPMHLGSRREHARSPHEVQLPARRTSISRSRSPPPFRQRRARHAHRQWMMLLSSAETGEPVAFLADAGHLTDVRTAAVAALVARELGRQRSRARHSRDRHPGAPAGPDARRDSGAGADRDLGPHAGTRRGVPPRSSGAAAAIPKSRVAESPADVARRARLIATATAVAPAAAARRRSAARHAHLRRRIGLARQAGTRPRDPAPRRASCWPIRAASVRSWVNCSTPRTSGARAIEIGEFCLAPSLVDPPATSRSAISPGWAWKICISPNTATRGHFEDRTI